MKRRILLLVILFFSLSCSALMYNRYDFPVPEVYGAKKYYLLNDEQKRAFLKNEKKYDNKVIDDILKHTLRTGMTKEQVAYSWGDPEKINKSGGTWGAHEQWVYRKGNTFEADYLYFDNGKLTSWQISQ